MYVVGSVPYDHLGQVVTIVHDLTPHDFGDGLLACCGMSGKPHGQMPPDYYVKVSNYVGILSSYARAIDPSASHTNYPARASQADESVFVYHDSATSRSGLSAVTGKLKQNRVAIVGLGGTGSYILDLVAKTPVHEIHLYDDDLLLAHNAFRAPGAVSLEELNASPTKVEHFAKAYGAMRRNVLPHPVRVDESNVGELQDMDFVFLAMDAGPSKRVIVNNLIAWNRPFVDVGMGVTRRDNALRGTVRVTTALPGHYDHVLDRVSFGDVNENEYDWNIQTADLNMLNASLAVIKWKKIAGFYEDTKSELNSTYTLAPNRLVNGEVA
jgi:hypothetical protein